MLEMLPLAGQLQERKFNRFLATLPRADFSLLEPLLKTIALERGFVLNEGEEEVEHVYFPHCGMVSVVTVMMDGEMVEAATIGPAGVINANAGLGARQSVGRSIVQLPGSAQRIGAHQFHSLAINRQAIRDHIVRYNDALLAQVQQSVACNALHGVEKRLCRWILQSADCIDGDVIPLTQEFLAEMLGVRRTSVTFAARALQNIGLIHYRRGIIQIANRSRLEEMSCECYATVRRNLDKVFPPLTPAR